MKSRPVAAAFFVTFCLLLCVLILRRQISAHPLPPDSGSRRTEAEQPGGDGGGRFGGDFQNFHPASPAVTAAAQKTVRGQMDALNAGDGAKALSFGSAGLRRRFSDPAEFMAMISAAYPEFRHSRRVDYGPAWADQDGDRVRQRVGIDGQDGRRVRAVFALSREDGQFKVVGVRMFPDK